MNQVRRQVRLYKAGRCLREELRDMLVNEAEGMRARMREFTRQLQDMARPSTRPGAVARDFDRDLQETVRSARSAHFDDAWKSFQKAMAALRTMEETWMAYQSINQLKDRLSGLGEQLGGVTFVTIEDFHVFLTRAMAFYEQEKYRTARFIAAESLGTLARLTTAAPESEVFAGEALERIAEQDDVAGRLEAWGVAHADAAEIRKSTEAIRKAVSLRQFEFARLLLGDLEAEKSPIRTFMSLAQARTHTDKPAEVARKLLGTSGESEDTDWAGAIARLLDQSFSEMSELLGSQLPVAGENGT